MKHSHSSVAQHVTLWRRRVTLCELTAKRRSRKTMLHQTMMLGQTMIAMPDNVVALHLPIALREDRQLVCGSVHGSRAGSVAGARGSPP